MKILFPLYLSIIAVFLPITEASATVFRVASQQEFDAAHDDAGTDDSIIWESGTYSDIYMEISKPNLFIAATTLGATVFTGESRVKITSDYITLQGFQFVDGDIGDEDVINTAGSYNTFNQLNIRGYISYKYLVIREQCQYAKVTYCNFENRLNLDDKNILSILVSASQPGYHKIQYCSFKNFDGSGNDLGIEPIRIGLSTQADRNSRSLVEFCYFTQCNGDGEIISSKASQNVYRYNTFSGNPKAELVLRHGSEAIVYGNFFIDGKGGVRVREGQDHYIYNNYFYEIDDRPIYLQNESSDPLDNINIAFNTIFDCSEIRLGSNGNFAPTNVSFTNNIFADPDDDLFENATGTETWIGNISQGNLGITMPSSGITIADPRLVKNSEGFYGLAEDSPAINAAMTGYAFLPQFEGMDEIDTEVMLDMMRQERSSLVEERDLGSNEFPHNVLIQPIATEENTGPGYNSSVVSSVKKNSNIVDDLVEISPNPIQNQGLITLHLQNQSKVLVHILDLNGKIIRTILKDEIAAGERTFKAHFKNLSSGTYSLQVISSDSITKAQKLQSIKFIKL